MRCMFIVHCWCSCGRAQDNKLILGVYFRVRSAGTGKLCIFGNLGLVFIWISFVSSLLFLLFYVSLRNLCSGTHRRNRLFTVV